MYWFCKTSYLRQRQQLKRSLQMEKHTSKRKVPFPTSFRDDGMLRERYLHNPMVVLSLYVSIWMRTFEPSSGFIFSCDKVTLDGETKGGVLSTLLRDGGKFRFSRIDPKNNMGVDWQRVLAYVICQTRYYSALFPKLLGTLYYISGKICSEKQTVVFKLFENNCVTVMHVFVVSRTNVTVIQVSCNLSFKDSIE